MSKYTKTVKFEAQFDGDNVSCNFRRLSRADMTLTTSMIDYSRVDENGFPCEDDNTKMLNAVIDMLPRYIDGQLHGLTDADGNVISIEEVAAEGYFLPLATAMATSLMNSSAISETDEGNSGAQPTMSYSGQGTSVGCESAA